MKIDRPVVWSQDDACPSEDTLDRACQKFLCVTEAEALKAAVSSEDRGDAVHYVMPSGHVVVVSWPGACAIWGPEPSEEWLVYTLMERGHGDVHLWWGPNHSGYTRYIEEAGRYTKEEASKIVGLRVELGRLWPERLRPERLRPERLRPEGALSKNGAAAVRLTYAMAKVRSVIPCGAFDQEQAK